MLVIQSINPNISIPGGRAGASFVAHLGAKANTSGPEEKTAIVQEMLGFFASGDSLAFRAFRVGYTGAILKARMETNNIERAIVSTRLEESLKSE